MIRVMLLSTDLQRGGLPLRLARIAPLLPRVGVEPIVGCLASPGPLSSVLESAGVRTFSCDAQGSFDPRCLARLAAAIREYDPDVLHASLFHANVAARLVGRLDRSRPIITSTVTIEIERAWHRWLESLTGSMSDLHVVNSRAVSRHVVEELAFSRERVVVLPNGIDLDAIRCAPPIDRAAEGIAEDAKLIVWAGRMDPVKDLDTLLQVAAVVSKQLQLRVMLLGDGPQRSFVQSSVERLGLTKIVRLVGWRDDVVSWMKAADAMLFTSRTEGSPNTLLEAIACGCPFVSGDVPSCRELVESSGCGSLAAPGRVADFAQKLMQVLQTGRLVGKIAPSPAFLQLHDLPSVVGQWGELFRAALAGSHN